MERAEFDKWRPREVARLLSLVETERRYYQEIVACLPSSILIVGEDLRIASANRSFRQRVRRKNEDVLGHDLLEFLPDAGEIVRAVLDGVSAVGRQSLELSGQAVNLTVLPLRSWEEDSEPEALLIVENESTVRLSPDQERALSAVAALDGVLWEQDLRTKQLTFASAAAAEILGYTPAQLVEDASLWPLRVAEPDRGRVEALYARLSHFSGDQFAIEYRGRDAEGGEQWLREAVRLRRDPDGNPVWLTGSTVRIGPRREIEHARAVALKSDGLQKLGARLAHDLNNLLMIVGGYGEELKNALPAGHPLHQDMHEILAATNRLSSLTTQLQAYTRRPSLEPRALQFAPLLEALRSRLAWALGPGVDLEIEEQASLHRLEADPGQAEESLLSLARLAAGVLDGQGQLSIRASNSTAEEGSGRPCVLVTLTLSAGEFPSFWLEPWLAPDEARRELALGVATAYQALRLGGGDLRISGRRAVLEFPAVTAAQAPEPIPVPLPAPGPVDATPSLETVLVVEDEGGIRALVRKILRRQGYEVLEAPGGAEALEILREHGPRINLLLTDVMMPGMNGVELSQQATAAHPGLRVLFVSGYTDDSVLEAGRFPAGAAFLQKPFTLGSLLGKVREVLDSGAARQATS
jgi:two-component system cell cycle sensor histidine kinase/response regulator CckA